MRLLDRHVLRDLWVPFLIGLFIFVTILLGDAARRISAAISNPAISTQQVLLFLLYRGPHAFVWSLPVGTLVGVSMAVNRLTRENELTAIRAAGVSFVRVCRWYLVFGVLASVAAFAVNEYVVPKTNERSQEIYSEMTQSQPFMREERNVLFRGPQGRMYFIGHMDPRTRVLERVMIVTFDQRRRPRSFILAERAQGAGKDWHLLNGFVHKLDEHGNPAPTGPEPFDVKRMDLGEALRTYASENRGEFEMGTGELRKLIQAHRRGGRDAHRLAVEYHFKYAIPAACLVFVLVGAPLSYRYAHSGGYMGLLLAILVVFLYNGVRSWAQAFGLAGALQPAFAAWVQNVLFGGWGIYLLIVAR